MNDNGVRILTARDSGVIPEDRVTYHGLERRKAIWVLVMIEPVQPGDIDFKFSLILLQEKPTKFDHISFEFVAEFERKIERRHIPREVVVDVGLIFDKGEEQSLFTAYERMVERILATHASLDVAYDVGKRQMIFTFRMGKFCAIRRYPVEKFVSLFTLVAF